MTLNINLTVTVDSKLTVEKMREILINELNKAVLGADVNLKPDEKELTTSKPF